MNNIDMFYFGLILFVASIIVYRIFSWRWEDAKIEAKLEEESFEWRALLVSIANVALIYRGPADSEEERRGQARVLDVLLAEYKELRDG